MECLCQTHLRTIGGAFVGPYLLLQGTDPSFVGQGRLKKNR